MTKRQTHPCERCETPTELRGWVYVMPKSRPWKSLDDAYKRYKWWCRTCYMESMFGLWPYTCTDECRESHSKKIGIVLHDKDTHVWVDMSTVLRIQPGKPVSPKCPWCRKAMKPVILKKDKKNE